MSSESIENNDMTDAIQEQVNEIEVNNQQEEIQIIETNVQLNKPFRIEKNKSDRIPENQLKDVSNALGEDILLFQEQPQEQESNKNQQQQNQIENQFQNFNKNSNFINLEVEDDENNNDIELKRKKIKMNDNCLVEGEQFFQNRVYNEEMIEDLKVVPWAKTQTLKIQNTLLRFHNEIIDFYNYIKPSDYEQDFRSQSVERLMNLIKSTLPETELQCYGSFITKTYLPNGSIDMVVIDQTKQNTVLRSKVAQFLQSNPSLYDNVNVLKSAKLPIIKFVEKITQIHFEMSFNKLDTADQIKEVTTGLEHYPELLYIWMIVKVLLKQRDLHETYSGGVSSFLLFCMILTFLRELRKQYYAQNKMQQLQDLLLSEYLLKFLEFYGNRFDPKTQFIRMRDGGSIEQKTSLQDTNFSVISPVDPTQDIGNSAFRINDVLGLFKNRYNFLVNYNYSAKESVLKYLLNPSKQEFIYIK